MADGKWIAYLRVSTQRQGKSGLGLEAQRAAVTDFLNGGDWSLVKEYVEVESGKRSDNRPELAKAIQACRAYGAKLVIARLNRLSRNAHFLLGLKEAGVDFVCADMPQANRLTVGIMAMVAEEERATISANTKAALAAAKRRGVKLGGTRGGRPTAKTRKLATEAIQARAVAKAADIAPIIAELKADGVTSQTGLAKSLTNKGIPTPRGGNQWTATQVARVLERTQ